MEYMEVSAKTVEEAITKACMELGRVSADLEIEVISEGSTGFLGFGSKPAVIQVRVKEDAAPADEEKAAGTKGAEKTGRRRSRGRGRHFDREEGDESRSENRREDHGEHRNEKAAEAPKRERPVHVEKKPEPVVPRTEEEVAAMKEAAATFLKSVFAAMDMPVEVSSEYDQETGSLAVDLAGDDMGVLIGKRGQTLDSLQYLVSLVVNKGQNNYTRVKLDTEDYRRRRRDTLENLAKNIASKVKRSGEAVSLEPMNPYERRIIHSALQGNAAVETYSEGNEPYRHVVVAPAER